MKKTGRIADQWGCKMNGQEELARRITQEREALRMRLRGMVCGGMNDLWEGQKSSGGHPEEDLAQAQHELLRDEQTRTYALLTARANALDRAWESLRRGTYGICQICGTHIPRRRLEAVPAAAFCVSCQEQMEQAA